MNLYIVYLYSILIYLYILCIYIYIFPKLNQIDSIKIFNREIKQKENKN